MKKLLLLISLISLLVACNTEKNGMTDKVADDNTNGEIKNNKIEKKKLDGEVDSIKVQTTSNIDTVISIEHGTIDQEKYDQEKKEKNKKKLEDK